MMFYPKNASWGISSPGAYGDMFLTDPFGNPQVHFLSDLPIDRWVQLTDREGRPAPVEIIHRTSGVYGRWLV
jgi:hypothetical protein